MKKWLKIKDLFRNIVFRRTDVTEITIVVQTVQQYGRYDLLVTDASRTYSIGLGAILCGDVKIPKGKWQEAMAEITPGTTLKIRVRPEELVESSGAITVLRLVNRSK